MKQIAMPAYWTNNNASGSVQQKGYRVLPPEMRNRIVRAALMFFDEEMTPHGTDAMRPYFDTSLGEPPGTYR